MCSYFGNYASNAAADIAELRFILFPHFCRLAIKSFTCWLYVWEYGLKQILLTQQSVIHTYTQTAYLSSKITRFDYIEHPTQSAPSPLRPLFSFDPCFLLARLPLI